MLAYQGITNMCLWQTKLHSSNQKEIDLNAFRKVVIFIICFKDIFVQRVENRGEELINC